MTTKQTKTIVMAAGKYRFSRGTGISYVVGDWEKSSFHGDEDMKGQRMAGADLSRGVEERRGEEISQRFVPSWPSTGESRFIEHNCGGAENVFESFRESRNGRRWE